MERALPSPLGFKVRRGDVLRLFGKPADIARAARLLGEAEAPSNATDFVYLGAGLVVGVLIGALSVPVAGVSLSLGSAGALLSGLAFGWMRSRRPTFGRFPPAASQILKDLGLASLHCSNRADFRARRSGAAEDTRLATASRRRIRLARPDAGLGLYRPISAAHGARDPVWRDRRAASQHARHKGDRSRRRQLRSGHRLHRDLRDSERPLASVGTHICRSFRRHERASDCALGRRLALPKSKRCGVARRFMGGVARPSPAS